MYEKRYTPAAAAKACGLGVSTVRLWAKQYGEFMSPLGNPGGGQARSFSTADLAVFQAVKEMRARENLTVDQCRVRLREMPPGDLAAPFIEGETGAIDTAAGADDSGPALGAGETGGQAGAGGGQPAALALPAPAVPVDSVALLQRLLERQEQTARDVAAIKTGAVWLAVGAGAGAVLVLVIVLVVLLLLR